MNNLPFEFPVIGVPIDQGTGFQSPDCFFNEESFSIIYERDLRTGERIGMVLFDAGGRVWRVRSVAALQVIGRRLSRALRGLFRVRRFLVSHDLVEEPPITLDELKDILASNIRANPDAWRDDEAVAGEDGPPRDENEMLEELIGRVRAAPDLLGVANALEAATY